MQRQLRLGLLKGWERTHGGAEVLQRGAAALGHASGEVGVVLEELPHRPRELFHANADVRVAEVAPVRVLFVNWHLALRILPAALLEFLRVDAIGERHDVVEHCLIGQLVQEWFNHVDGAIDNNDGGRLVQTPSCQ